MNPISMGKSAWGGIRGLIKAGEQAKSLNLTGIIEQLVRAAKVAHGVGDMIMWTAQGVDALRQTITTLFVDEEDEPGAPPVPDPAPSVTVPTYEVPTYAEDFDDRMEN